jgi:lysophospholipase L1-like esterase
MAISRIELTMWMPPPGITLGCLLILSLAIVSVTSACADAIDPSDANIQYTGRWNQSNPSQPWAQAKGASIIANFEGTSLALTVTTGNQEYYRIIIDGDALVSTKIQLPSGSAALVASGLADTTHRVEIVKETDAGRATFLGFELDAGKSLATPPARPPRRLIFYGDSNLAGHSLESEQNQGGAHLTGSYYTYAGITARMFDAEYHNISKSGATIQSLNSRFSRTDWGTNNPSWNFASFVADVVIVNIGANDVFSPKNTVKNRYHALLDDLRVAHPLAHITLYNAYGWDESEPANYTAEVIAERADPNMSSAVFPWVFEQFHGCEYDHGGMAQYLAEHLAQLTGWTAAPADVMSGYALNGMFANGSFEQRAPFGGWGWRYFDDPGVSRVHDPVGAFDGDYFLRLSGGASSHQTNPAIDGDPVSLTAWMRGATGGEQVDITIDFRDQQAGAEIATPLQSATETKTLTSAWQQVSMTATAPTGAANPVFSTRATFAEVSGAGVDIDDVIVFVPEPTGWVQIGSGAAILFGLARRRTRR